jgi:hypothetical protein
VSARVAKWLIAVGIGPIAFGVFLLRYGTRWGYSAVESTSGCVLIGIGVLLFGIGLGRLTKWAVGAAAFVLGLGIALFRCHSAESSADEAQRIEIERAAAARAAAPACDGKGIAAAAPLADNGLRPVFIVSIDGDKHREAVFDARWRPNDLASAQLVACEYYESEVLGTCMYEGPGQHRMLTRKRHDERIVIREARTAKVIAERTFHGAEPPKECPDSIRSNERDFALEGPMPTDGEIHDFVRSFVERART